MKVLTSVLAVSAASAAALFTPCASAQAVGNIGHQGQFVVGVERVTGLFFDSQKIETNGGDNTNTTSTTSIALLGNGPLLGPSTLPRFGFDYLVIDGLSLGLSAVYINRTGELETEAPGGSQTTELNSVSLLLLQPRIGYAYPFSDVFGIWPRLGFLWAHTTTNEEDVSDPMDNLGESTGNFTFLTIEGNLVISPIQHFAFVGGPFLDLGLGGAIETNSGAPGAVTENESTKFTSFGLAIGVAGYF